MKVRVNGIEMQDLYPLFEGQEISLGIDSSKSNTGIVVGDAECKQHTAIEISGKYDGTTEIDCLKLCWEIRKAVKTLFKGSKIIIAGIEDIISKNEGQSYGIKYHESRFKITAVFNSIITALQDEFYITPELVNNWDWKVTTLPDEYRKRTVYKGSKLYLASMNSKFGDYSDDVTDAYFILEYLKIKHRVCNLPLVPYNDKQATIESITVVGDRTYEQFQYQSFDYNKSMSFTENCRCCLLNPQAIIRINFDDIPYQLIWNNMSEEFKWGNSRNAYLLIRRGENA